VIRETSQSTESKLAYTVDGDKDSPAMVLLHGAWAVGTDWDPVIPAFAGDHRVYVPTYVGTVRATGRGNTPSS